MANEIQSAREWRPKFKPIYGYSACMFTIAILGAIALKKKPPIVIINTVSPVLLTDSQK